MRLDPLNNDEDAKYEDWILYRYKIDADQYNDILDKQGGVCGICGTDDPTSKNGRFVVDHCHATGRVRGLLCPACNSGLGALGDGIPGLVRATNYLMKFEGYDSLSDCMAGRKSEIKVIVVKYARRKNLVMRYDNPITGKQVSKSAKTSDRDEAKARAALWQIEVNLRRSA